MVRDSDPNNIVRKFALLLVDDNPGDAELFREVFQSTGYPMDLHIVSDGQAAVDFLFRRGEFSSAPPVDVVLLDINLPRKNGLEVLAEIREDSKLRDLPVFILSGSRNKEDVSKANAFNVAGFLEKPRDLADLESMTQRLFTVEFPRVLNAK